MLKKPQQSTGPSPRLEKAARVENPYLAARREWNERYGSYIARERTWQLAAFGCLLVTFLAVGGLAYVATRSQFVPYVIEVDRLGRPAAAGPITKAPPGDPRVMAGLIARFIEDWRAVTSDGALLKHRLTEAFAFISRSDPAHATLIEYATKANNPFERAKTETVSVQMEAIFPISDKTWQAEWVETVRDRRGQLKDRRHYKGAFIVEVAPKQQRPEKERLVNPIGLFILEFDWSEVEAGNE
ncbi:MAG: hypothetical protein JXJ18_14335 [Rhodobacteraceae bacterium]|nr:hypothetical protein [Paracoccaceae bacterium]